MVAVASVVAAPVCVSVAIQAVAFLKIPPLWGGSLAILQSLHLIGTFFAFLWKYSPEKVWSRIHEDRFNFCESLQILIQLAKGSACSFFLNVSCRIFKQPQRTICCLHDCLCCSQSPLLGFFENVDDRSLAWVPAKIPAKLGPIHLLGGEAGSSCFTRGSSFGTFVW